MAEIQYFIDNQNCLWIPNKPEEISEEEINQLSQILEKAENKNKRLYLNHSNLIDKYENPDLKDFVTYVSLDEIWEKSDLISLHCPLFPETYHMINKESIAKMKDTVTLVNTSRGGLIDTEDLIDALRAKKFAAVGLDVYENEDDLVFEDYSSDIIANETVPRLLAFPNVMITSHQAFFTREALQSIAITTLENAYAFEHGLPLENIVQ